MLSWIFGNIPAGFKKNNNKLKTQGTNKPQVKMKSPRLTTINIGLSGCHRATVRIYEYAGSNGLVNVLVEKWVTGTASARWANIPSNKANPSKTRSKPIGDAGLKSMVAPTSHPQEARDKLGTRLRRCQQESELWGAQWQGGQAAPLGSGKTAMLKTDGRFEQQAMVKVESDVSPG